MSDLQTELIRYAKQLGNEERIKVFNDLYRRTIEESDFDAAELFRNVARACQEYWKLKVRR